MVLWEILTATVFYTLPVLGSQTLWYVSLLEVLTTPLALLTATATAGISGVIGAAGLIAKFYV